MTADTGPIGLSGEELPPGETRPGETRRDFLVLLAGAMAGIGLGSAIWPFIASMDPAADTLAAGAPVDVDVSKMEEGQQIVVLWRGRPIFIIHRNEAELKMLQSAQDTSLLSDPDSKANQQPSYARNWHRSIKPEYVVLVGICTHLGCVPEFKPNVGDLDPDWPGGYFCPCHGSRYDLAGRVFQNVPAPYNLPVPPHHFVSDASLRIGENPPGSTFDFSSIEQL
jgi:ubiquinol-cytochrome c reductase iron-sulfur subunit